METDVDGGPSFTVGDQYPMNTDIYLRNSLNQNFTLNTGSLIQAKFDGEQDFDGILSKIRTRSEEHTSDLQSLMRISSAVFCLKTNKTPEHNTSQNHTTTR